MLHNLKAPLGLTKTKARFIKLKVVKFCILNENLLWKDASGVLLNFLLKNEVNRVMQEFHEGDRGGHLYWKTTANKILRAGFYWPTLFSNTKRRLCHATSAKSSKVNEFVSINLEVHIY